MLRRIESSKDFDYFEKLKLGRELGVEDIHDYVEELERKKRFENPEYLKKISELRKKFDANEEIPKQDLGFFQKYIRDILD